MKNFYKFIILSIISIFLSLNSFAFFKKESSKSPLWVELSKNESIKNKINLPSLAPLVSKVANAVLIVTTEAIIKRKKQNLPLEFEQGPFQDFFKFFDQQHDVKPERKTRGQGSGFIIHPEGFALTNQHVVDGATSIKIKVGNDLQEYDAEIVGSDITTDVALIKIKSSKKNWPVIPLGSSKELKVGDFAIAIGNPFGLELSVSMGIVSARGRRQITPSGRKGLYDFIQIDNSINFGNSGGPLLNMKGEVVGINTAISAQGHGIAFSIPIDQVKKILPQLKENGEVSRAYLGVRILNVIPDLAKALGMKTPYGALVREVMINSPADKAGIKAGDVITHFNKKIVKNASSLQVMSGLSGIGKIVPIKLFRNKKSKSFILKLEKMPQVKKNKLKIKPTQKNVIDIKSLGFSVTILNDKTRKTLKLIPRTKGALVVSVQQGSIAHFSGIKINDLITELNRKKINSPKKLNKIIKKTKKGEILRFFLQRGKVTIFIAISKP